MAYGTLTYLCLLSIHLFHTLYEVGGRAELVHQSQGHGHRAAADLTQLGTEYLSE